MRVAIVHDFLNQYGGAERCVEMLKEIYPDAPIFTSIYLPENLPSVFKSFKINTSFIQKFPFLKNKFKHYFFLYPFAMRNFNLKDYDCVISSSSSYAMGVRIPKRAVHICYCHTPPRFLWRTDDYLSRDSVGVFIKWILKPILFLMKKWDLYTTKSVDHFIANSKNVQERIKKFYYRESVRIYPPVNVNYFTPSPSSPEDYYLIISRLAAYKRLDLAIDTFNELKYPLRIIGRGLYEKKLKCRSGATVKFLGGLSDEEMLRQIRRCKALIFPGDEDFGIAPIEAQACGRPVIAYGFGGALETIKDPETGVLFYEPSVASLKSAIKRFETMKFDQESIRAHAKQFSSIEFKNKIRDFVNEKMRANSQTISTEFIR